jgi:hypothetical protein
MDFIERWLGILPDGGDGTLEALAIAIISVGIVVVVGSRVLCLSRRGITPQ